MATYRSILLWAMFGTVVVGPIVIAVTSPLLQWRDPLYVAACFAGIIAMVFVYVQPLLAGSYLPGLSRVVALRLHAIIGIALVLAMLIHVGGLWITSPPDMIDALLFRSPTPFSVWGVVGMWALIAAAMVAGARPWLRSRRQLWKRTHTALASFLVLCAALHAILVEGLMGTFSKAVLCAFAVAATLKLILDLWSRRLPARYTDKLG